MGCSAIAAVLVFNALAANVSAFVPPLSSSVRGEFFVHHERETGRQTEWRAVYVVFCHFYIFWCACGVRAMVHHHICLCNSQQVWVDVDVLSAALVRSSYTGDNSSTAHTLPATTVARAQVSPTGEVCCPAK